MIEFFDERRVRESLDWSSLVEALAAAFAAELATVPDRHHHRLARQGEDAPTLLLMPAWTEAYLGVKVVSVFPRNQARHLPTVTGAYLLMSGRTGEPLAYLDAQELTARRTAATSLLAASRLARPDSSTLLVVGAGRIARLLIDAYRSWFPLQRIVVWNHRPEGASKVVRELRTQGCAAERSEDLAASCHEADIVTCATLSRSPLVRGDWLKPGTHVDLVGGFTPEMREADDEAIRRGMVYVDSMAGALSEAGDIVRPIADGVIREADLAGDLFTLANMKVGERKHDDVTVFKSVGHALEDLVAAITVYEVSGRNDH